MLTKPTDAKTRLISALGAFIHSEVPQVLSLQSNTGGKSVAPAAISRDFSSSSLVAQTLVLRCGFNPTSVCVLQHMSAPEPAWSTGTCPSRQVDRGGGIGGWSAQTHLVLWDWKKQLWAGWESLLRLAPLLIPTEAGARVWEGDYNGSPAPCTPLNNGTLLQ